MLKMNWIDVRHLKLWKDNAKLVLFSLLSQVCCGVNYDVPNK